MKQTAAVKIIAEICRDFPTKFGIPRQSGLVPERETLRDIEGYSHLWLLWEFSEVWRESWRPTVRRLGVGNHPELGTVLRVAGAGLMDGALIYRNADHLVLHLKSMYNIANICSAGSNGLQSRADFEKAKPLIDRACDEN